MGGSPAKPPTPPPPSPLLEKEWRKVPWGENRKYLEVVRNYTPHNDELQQLRVLLYGLVASGKSSFINSVYTTLQGRMAGPALANSCSQGSFTVKYRTYKIQKGKPETFYPFAFTDLMGIEKEPQRGVNVEDIKLAIKGHIRDGYTFNPMTKISEDDSYYNEDPTLNDKVHVLVFVIPAPTVNILNAEFIRKMWDVRLAARDMDIPQMAILTKIDEACPEVKNNIRNVYKSKHLKEQMETVSVKLGIPQNCIFPVKNYHSEIDPDDDTDTLLLSALTQMIYFGEDFVNGL